MGEHILGRDDELAALTKFLAQPSSLPDVLALEGEPGIGKTTLWMAALREARDRGYLVLTAQPVQVESGLSFAGLRDLLERRPTRCARQDRRPAAASSRDRLAST